jgi:hypothetical protein
MPLALLFFKEKNARSIEARMALEEIEAYT